MIIRLIDKKFVYFRDRIDDVAPEETQTKEDEKELANLRGQINHLKYVYLLQKPINRECKLHVRADEMYQTRLLKFLFLVHHS